LESLQYSKSDKKTLNTIINSIDSREKALLLLECKDEFLATKPIQPKREIAEYVRSEISKKPSQFPNLRVPKIMANLSECMSYNREWYIRSEHPQDYSWVSDLADSYRVLPSEILKLQSESILKEENFLNIDSFKASSPYDRNKIKKEILKYYGVIPDSKILKKMLELSSSAYWFYADLLWISLDEILEEASFSFWEYIPWYNHTVVGDMDVPGRYYISTKRRLYYWDDPKNINYEDFIVVQDWEIITDTWHFYSGSRYAKEKPVYLDDRRVFDHNNIIHNYESISWLDKFDSGRTPIMEFQTSIEDNSLYFLQTHLGRNRIVKKQAFTIDTLRGKKDNEFESLFVRWVTNPEGIILDIWYMHNEYYSWFSYEIVNDEWWAMSYNSRDIFRDAMSQNRTLCINHGVFIENMQWHASITQLFKHEIFVFLKSLDNDLPWEDYDFSQILMRISQKQKSPYRFQVKIVSDWDTAYLKVLTSIDDLKRDYFNIFGVDFDLEPDVIKRKEDIEKTKIRREKYKSSRL